MEDMEFSNQMGGEHFICGGLNINGPHNFMYFNAKSLVCRTVWDRLEDMVSLEEEYL